MKLPSCVLFTEVGKFVRASQTNVAMYRAGNAMAHAKAAAGINVTTPDLGPFITIGQQTYKELAERLGSDLVGKVVGATK